jgi:hypothetical protein
MTQRGWQNQIFYFAQQIVGLRQVAHTESYGLSTQPTQQCQSGSLTWEYLKFIFSDPELGRPRFAN